MKRTIVFAIYFFLMVACKQRSDETKFLGTWIHTTDSRKQCKITKSANNFILEYKHPAFYDITDDKVYVNGTETMPAFYDKSKDKLVVKWKKDIDVIYDENTNQLVFESWGAFKK